MSDDQAITMPQAAHRLGVPLRDLRLAIRNGTVPAPSNLTATAFVSAEWLDSARAAVAASPKALSAASRQKVPAFARYEGTSAWRKYAKRVREYNHYRAHSQAA